MENPVFKLEKVVHTRTEEMQDFEGPLDLILFLLSRNRMEIQDISVSLICDQYLEWLAVRQSMDLEIASEFVVMASQLMVIKSRMLLAIEDEETKNEMDALIESLEERRRNERYALIREMAEGLAPLGEFGRLILTRPGEPAEHGKVYVYNQKPEDLLSAIAEIRQRMHQILPTPEAAFREIARHEPYPVESKAREILRAIQNKGLLSLLALFRGCRSRSEIVATFLAILELCRSRMLRLLGEGKEFSIQGRIPEEPEEEAVS